MLAQCWASQNANALSSSQLLFFAFSNPRKHPKFNLARYPKKPGHLTCVLKVGFEDVAEILHNKVLIAAGVSAAIGQLSKPFTSVILYGKDLDFRTAFQAGGFPSTHSSSVVAAASALALERGFADSIFGLSMVYAGLVMYDAQGVRREVGNHARVLNKLLSDAELNKRSDRINSQGMSTLLTKEVSSSFFPKPSETSQAQRSDDVNRVKQSDQMLMSSKLAAEVQERDSDHPLKETIGHTEVEVVAGALLGFFVSLAVYTVL